MKKIYLDHAATTPVAGEVAEAMRPFLSERFGNASSLHSLGREAARAIENARGAISKRVKAKGHKLVFTSGGTESNNLALKGFAFANRDRGKHIITSSVEHDCILNSCKWLERQGFRVTYLPVDREGFIDLGELERAITKETILVSIIHGNNEIGTIEPIGEIGKICSRKGVCFHTDACQSFTKVPIDLGRQDIDLLTINAHKIYGPKGIGGLFVRDRLKLDPILHGGGHESGLRSGTENVPGIVGFAKAAEIARESDIGKMEKLRDMLIGRALETEESWLNGPRKERLCNNANLTFRGVEGESLILHLDARGIEVSTGSACSSRSLETSHVLRAIGVRLEDANSTVRFSLGRENTKEEIEYTIKVLRESVDTLRKISPLWNRG